MTVRRTRTGTQLKQADSGHRRGSRASCLMGQPRRTLRSRPRTPGHRYSEGRINLQSFLPLPLEGDILSPVSRTSSTADLPLLREFSSLYSFFFMFDVLAHILLLGRLQPLYVSYIYVLCLPAPPFFLLHFLLAYFSFLFLCAPYALSIWRAIS